MTNAQALLIGVNHVNPAGYGGKWDGRLKCPEDDAATFQKLIEERGFSCQRMLSEAATADAVLGAIGKAARELHRGDFFLFYYSGHGNRVVDQSGDEADRGDETFCLYDRQLLDDELAALWPDFEAGVRVLVIADMCHSGSATRNAVDPDRVVKAVDEQTNNRIMRKDRDYYKKLRESIPVGTRDVRATIGLISGCMDHQQSFENRREGLSELTLALSRAIRAGEYADYTSLHEAIIAVVPPEQTPQLSFYPEDDPPMKHEPPLTP